jgi:lysophospholipase L1-like esterase
MRLALWLAAAVIVAAPPDPIVVYLAGDSTMAQKTIDRRPETGWGEKLQQYFAMDQVRVENEARNGRSTRTFLEEGRWQSIVDRLKPGDYVFIQFGHNDESPEKTDRYTPPDAFRRNLARFVDDVRTKRAHPVLLTPVRRRKFGANGQLVDTHGEYPDLVRSVAAEKQVPLLDLHVKTGELLREHGPDRSRLLFLQLKPGEHPNYPNGIEDNTHYSPLGAELTAKLVVDAMLVIPSVARDLRLVK